MLVSNLFGSLTGPDRFIVFVPRHVDIHISYCRKVNPFLLKTEYMLGIDVCTHLSEV